MNKVAFTLTCFGWVIIIGGIIFGIYMSREYHIADSLFRSDFARELVGSPKATTTFNLANAIVYWFIAAISGVFLLGIAEIIKLLERLTNK